MLYTYNDDEIRFKKIKTSKYLLFVLILIVGFSVSNLSGYLLGLKKSTHTLTAGEISMILKSTDPFNADKLADMMISLNIKFPHIPFAQSILETGGWKSSVFIENHNLFGMKQATRRITTAKGTNKGHAYYDNWRESVYDYAFYQSRYLSSIKTESQYFDYLSASYAEDSMYVSKLKRIIENEKLREKFK